MVLLRNNQHTGNLAWVDLEMTGLDPDNDHIIEMAIVVTNKSLEVVAESKEWVLACEERVLAGMDKWNTSTHTETGLLDDVRKSTLDYATAEGEALEFMRAWVEEGNSPMCGNTICQDRRFLHRCMPKLHGYFHYRNLDVTSFKLASMFWLAQLPAMSKKDNLHRALSDIKESIIEMQAYREMLFKR